MAKTATPTADDRIARLEALVDKLVSGQASAATQTADGLSAIGETFKLMTANEKEKKMLERLDQIKSIHLRELFDGECKFQISIDGEKMMTRVVGAPAPVEHADLIAVKKYMKYFGIREIVENKRHPEAILLDEESAMAEYVGCCEEFKIAPLDELPADATK